MPDRRLTYTDPTSGLPTEILEESEIWGAGPIVSRPPTGQNTGDLWFLVQGGQTFIQRWNGSQWDTVLAIPGGPAGGDLQGFYPNPTVNLAAVPGGLFGTDYEFSRKQVTETTTSTTFQTYDDFITGVIPSGALYRVECNFSVTVASANTAVEARFLVDGSPTGSPIIIQPSEPNAIVPVNVADIFLGAGASLDFTLQYRKVGGSASVGITFSLFQLFRVG